VNWYFGSVDPGVTLMFTGVTTGATGGAKGLALIDSAPFQP
jgi:hypothetical protein